MFKTGRRGLVLIGAGLLGKWAEAADLLDFSQLQVSKTPQPAPDVAFLRPDGSQASLAGYRGRGLVLNFWATWCGPCVAELPSLDRLAGKGEDFTVLAVSEDTGDKAANVVKSYYAQHGISRLPVLVDRFGKASDAFNNQGVPTTLLIDAKGMVRARFEGGTKWDDGKAIGKIRGLIG